jgi:hypothetical protein
VVLKQVGWWSAHWTAKFPTKCPLWPRLVPLVSKCNILLHTLRNNSHTVLTLRMSRDSVVGIATSYGLEGPGIESRWGEIFRTYPDRIRGPPSLLYNGSGVFPGGKGGRGVILTTHPLLVPRLRNSWAIPPLTLWVLLGLLRVSLYPFYSQW